MERLSDLRLLVDAADLGSFSAAGRRHGVSPAAASACIQKIERGLGARLFERTTRRLRLTAEGQVYLGYCRQALEAMREADQALQAGRETVSGTVRISAPSDLGRNLLLDLLDSFTHLHPQVRLSLSLSDAVSDLVQDEIDLAIRVGPLADSSLIARRLAESWRVICASPAYLAEAGAPDTLSDLRTRPCLALVTGRGVQTEWRMGGETVRLERYDEANDSEVIRKWAIQGRGFAYRQIWAVAEDLKAGRLVLVWPDAAPEPAPLNALYHRNAFLPARLRLLLDHLQHGFAERLSALAEFRPKATASFHARSAGEVARGEAS